MGFQLVFTFCLFLSTVTFAQTEYETVVEDVIFNSSSKVVIDEKTIKDSKAPDLVSLITTHANITLFNNNFAPPQLFLRGGESSHILILIDDIPVFDVSWAQRTLNLNSLDISNIRRIEIIKGGQTVLHGGQALAGVIKIETFHHQYKNEKKVNVQHILADYTDAQVAASFEKAISENSGFVASARVAEGQNESPALNSSKLYDQTNHNVDLAYEKQGATTFRARGFYFRDKSINPTTVNGMTGQSVADSNIERQDDQLGISGQLVLNEVALKPRFSAYAQKGWRYYYSAPTSNNVDAKFRSQLQGALLDLAALDRAIFKINTGLSYQKEDYFLDDTKATLSVNPRSANVFSELSGAYVMAKIGNSDIFLFESGARLEKASGFSEKPSYQIGMTFFKNTKLEWVTGYRAPSASQVKGVFPNANLEPETSQTYSLTQDIPLGESGEVSATLFETSFDNYIEARSLGFGVLQYQNTAKVKTRGIELVTSYVFNPKQSLQMSYAYQEPWDQVRHEKLRRRPNVSGSLRFFQNEKYSTWMLEGAGVGERNDFFGNFRYTFPGYFLLNASISYKLKDNMAIALRGNNLLDFRPEISIDYYGEGRTAFLSWEMVW